VLGPADITVKTKHALSLNNLENVIKSKIQFKLNFGETLKEERSTS